MAYPTTIDAPGGTAAQGTTLLSAIDHALDHRTLGSAVIAIEQKLGLSAGTPVLGAFLQGSGNGTSIWSASLNNITLGSPTINGGTANNMVFGTPSISGGTANNMIFGTPSITGGSATNETFIGGTLNQLPQITTYQIGSAAYSPSAGGTVTITLGTGGTASRHLINMPNSAGNVTINVSGAVGNQPFIIEILQGTAGLGTPVWFNTIRWAGSAAPTPTTTANRKDTFGFITTGTAPTFDGYIIGQNV